MRDGGIRIEWQLYELDNGELHRCPPKDDPYRTVRVPGRLSTMVSEHIAATRRRPCVCHGQRYVFGGNRSANGATRRAGPSLVEVARRAGVSPGTVSNALNRPGVVADATRLAVRSAIADLGYVRHARSREPAVHWRRNGFATWLFQPAATGRYPAKAPQPVRPVPVSAGPWPAVLDRLLRDDGEARP